MNDVHLARPWLTFDLGCEMQVLSWAINRPGFVNAQQIIWREVRNADLPRDMDVLKWFDQELQQHDRHQSVAFLTSRDVSCFVESEATVEGVTAKCVATVGLSNAERVGARVDRQGEDWGTINVAVRLDQGLSQTGLIETLSIATQARTAAVLAAEVPVTSGMATGTGTDCIAVAAPQAPCDYAGLHTPVGEAVGAAVYRATLLGAEQWKSDITKMHARAKGPV